MAKDGDGAEARDYRLCVRRQGFSLKLAEVTLRLSDEGLAYEFDGRGGLRPFSQLASVRIQALHGGKHSPWEAMIELGFQRGLPLSVHSSTPWGNDEPERDRTFVAFVEDLHRRIPESEHGRIRFLRGIPEWRHKLLIGALLLFLVVFGGAGLVVLGLGISGRAPVLEVLGLLAGIGGFGAWILTSVAKARPGSYHPRHLPRDLFPE